MSVEESLYVMISNIPGFYHSPELRNFFSEFVETEEFACFHYRHRPENRSQSVSNEPNSPTFCAFVKLKNSDRLKDFKNLYHMKHWQDKNGDSIDAACQISTLVLSSCKDDVYQRHYSSKEVWDKNIDLATLTEKKLLCLPEMNPPALMPNGNIGTPTKHFFSLIQQSRLPPKIITKLGLVFPKMRTNRKYGNVSWKYENKDVSANQLNSHNFHKSKLKPTKEKTRNEHIEDLNDESEEEEEWERHEEIHDDPSNQDRNKERLFEQNMEVVWEKGGPGIVWYTDAQFWDEQEEEEEKDVDDWDVDFSEYYDPGTGDKDARDMADIRRTHSKKQTYKKAKQFLNKPSKIGQFERHSKGIGRKVLTKYGWRDGKGLGSGMHGLVSALDNDGQAPSDKTGFGYRGAKLHIFSSVHLPKNQSGEKSD